MYPLFIITVLLLFGVGLVFAQTDRQAVMAHWNERRCDLSVILASHLYKPANDPTSSTKFATDNLKFCTNKLITEVFTVALNPFLAVVGQQLQFTKVIEEVLANVKGMIAKFFRTFSKIIGGVYQRFIAVGFNFRKTFVMFLTAMNRAFGIAIGALFSGISMLVGVQNLVDAVIKIVLIVLGILAGLIVILFLAFFPVIPVVLTTITVMVAGVAAGFAAAGEAGPLKSVFCFPPNTFIETMRGLVTIGTIKVGDILKDGGVVEGVLEVNGSNTEIYSLRGTRVSGDHLVFYEPLGKWILVKEHPEARKEIKREPILICLNTSTREIPIGNFRFRDWEEIPPEDLEIQKAWNELIATMLGSEDKSTAHQYPLLSGAWFVQTPEGKVALRDISMGTKILDIDNSWTKVLGIYNGVEEVVGGPETFWFTDSIWWRKESTWGQISSSNNGSEIKYKRKGFHLVTDSGTFKIFSLTDEKSVRDFTEVGQARIAETYEWMKARL
jgi:hypothetical protein